MSLDLSEKARVLSVAELNLAVKQLLESSVPLLWVRGEVSNLVKAASGHCYFSLKDEVAQVRCVLFRHKSSTLTRPLTNGMQIEVLALATLYEQRGEFQLTIEQARPAGLGILYEQFEQLKQQLAAEGLFARKRPLPPFPRRVGVITSPQAAALRDVLSTLRLRLPSVPVILYPTPVQGVGSAAKIAQAIVIANQRAECDVLIVCRGGGSIEDLWAFNEEVVARAIAASALPIVSGVGHETDFTISDFVADERAPTPTAAAQRVVPDRHALLKGLDNTAQHLQRAQRNRLYNAMQTLDYLQRRLIHPAQQLHRQALQLDQLQQRMQRAFKHREQQYDGQWHSLAHRLNASRRGFLQQTQALDHLAQRLNTAWQHRHTEQNGQLAHLTQQLHLLDPQQVLGRGYSLVRNAQGRVVSDSAQLATGERLTLTFAQSACTVQVIEGE
ncbi:MAG: exodeoxyribonuclease VII large subunit [Gallionella sp.]